MIRTLKIKYQTDSNSLETIKNYMRQYSSLYHIVFNRTIEGSTQKEIKEYVKQMNNLDLLDSWFVQSSIFDVQLMVSNYKDIPKRKQEKIKKIYKKYKINFDSLSKTSKRKFFKKYKISKSNSITFGSKNSFRDFQKGLISKEELKLKRLLPLSSIGEVSNKCVRSNRKFHIEEDLSSILFKPCKTTSIKLEIKLASNYKSVLKTLYCLQETKEIPIAYRLDLDYLYIIYEETDIRQFLREFPKISDRVFAIDLNPNYIGWSVVDWKNSDENSYKVIKTGVYSIKSLNDYETALSIKSNDSRHLRITNRRKFEILEIAKSLVLKAKHYRCQIFAIEDLSIETSDKELGKDFNKLVNNQWNRNILINSLRRRCDLFNITFLKVKPDYSSFLGNILYRNLKLLDPILSSIEIGRRGYEFLQQYILKKKDQTKTVVFPNIEKFNEAVVKSLEEFNIAESFKSWKEMFEWFKDSKVWYRVPVSQELIWSEFKSKKSNISIINFDKSS